MRPLVPWLTFLGVVVACGGATSGEQQAPPALVPLVVDDGCQPFFADVKRDPTAPQAMCLLPYPSGYITRYLHNIPPIRTKSGATLDFGSAAPFEHHLSSGPPALPTIVATLPGDIVADGLPTAEDDPAVSTSPTSPTFIRREDGTLVPHSVEIVDTGDPLHKAIVIRPRESGGLVVGLRGVRLRNGELAPAPEGFRRIRDAVLDKCAGRPYSKEPSLEYAIYDATHDIPCDVPRAEQAKLQLLWWFDTGRGELDSSSSLSGNSFSAIPTPPPPRIDSVDDAKAPGARILRGTARLRRVVDSEQPVARFTSLIPSAESYRDVPFSIVIPPSVLAATTPARAILVGSKAFGSRTDIEGPEMIAMADRLHSVFFSVDWFGTSAGDLPFVRAKLEENVENILGVRDAMVQALVTWLDFFRLVQIPLTKLPELQRDGQCIYDASFLPFLGTGHPLDATFAVANPYRKRAAFLGSGVGLADVFSRWGGFAELNEAIAGSFSEPLLAQAFTSVVQSTFDWVEPALAARGSRCENQSCDYFGDNKPPLTVLLQLGVADSEVPNDTTWLLAQAFGARQTVPTNFRSSLLDVVEADGRGSGLTAFDYGLRAGPSASRPAPNDVHARLLTNDAALRQIDAFLRPDGRVIQPCDGPCDPQ